MTLTTYNDTALGQKCLEETQKYKKGLTHDDQYCYELFRRALVYRSPDALTVFMQTYEAQVKRWLYKAGCEQLDEPIEDLVSAVFAKLVKAITPHRFTGFLKLEDILEYFSKCSRTHVWQQLRKLKAKPPLELHEDYPDKQSVESQVDHHFLSRHIENLLKDEVDQLLFRLHYYYDMKPAEISATYPQIWKTAQHVSWHLYRLNQKLQADETLRSWANADHHND